MKRSTLILDWKKSKAVKALLLFTITVLTRLPFTSRFLYNWDSVQYALGTANFNVTYHQPHPPGYILYVAAGKILNSLTGNPNESFVILSVFGSDLAVAALYLFGVRNRRGARPNFPTSFGAARIVATQRREDWGIDDPALEKGLSI